MRKPVWKRLTACFLAGMLFLMGGCSGKSGPGSGEDGISPGEEPAKEKQMGRYLEEEITLPEEVFEQEPFSEIGVLQVLDSGELALLDTSLQLFVSPDHGKTWEKREVPGLDSLIAGGISYVPSQVLAPDGSVAVVYTSRKESGEGESGFHPKYFYLDGEGTEHPVEFSGGDDYLTELAFGRDSRLYGFSLQGIAYEISREDGSLRKIFETDGLVDYVCFTETYMVLFTSRGVTLYNLETGTQEGDEVLQSFLMENAGGEIGSTSGSHLVTAVAGEEKDVIYLALDKGIFRHVLGGTVMEEAADGNLNSLSDPQMYLHSMEIFSDEEFLILYNKNRLYRYIWDPNQPAVPEVQLSIYSLEEDYIIRQAVSLYQKENPGVFLRYEVGMSGDSGLTREDAIKNLNTRLLSGSGPDLISLDGLPAESYRQKGVLGDLTKLVQEMTGEDALFPNLVDACRTGEGELYALPVRFRISLLAGNSSLLKDVKDLASLADAVEKLRQEHPQGGITGYPMEEIILGSIAQSGCGAWTDADGAIDEKALTEFLTQAKRIYQAELAGYSEEELRMVEERKIWIYQEGRSAMDYYMSIGSLAISLGMGDVQLAVGMLGNMKSDFNTLTSVMKEKADIDFMLSPGQVEGGFLPVTRMGINAQSMENPEVLSFFRFLFGSSLQDMDLGEGFPMNMASFEKMKEDPSDGEDNSSVSISMAGGSGPEASFSLSIRWADEEQFERLENLVRSLNAICTGDSVIEEIVYETGAKVLGGSMDVKDAVDEIVKKAAIYLAE